MPPTPTGGVGTTPAPGAAGTAGAAGATWTPGSPGGSKHGPHNYDARLHALQNQYRTARDTQTDIPIRRPPAVKNNTGAFAGGEGESGGDGCHLFTLRPPLTIAH